MFISYVSKRCSFPSAAESMASFTILTKAGSPSRGPNRLFSHPDTYPSFQDLGSDDDRERKARFQAPGTYFVVATPDSFSDLPDYRKWQGQRSSASTVGSQSSEDWWSNFTQGAFESVADPTVHFVPRFEDSSPQTTQPPLGTVSAMQHNLAIRQSQNPRPTFSAPEMVRVPSNEYAAYRGGYAQSMRSISASRHPYMSTPHPAPPWHQFFGTRTSSTTGPSSTASSSNTGDSITRLPVRSDMSSRSGSVLEEIVGVRKTEQDAFPEEEYIYRYGYEQ